MGGRTMTIIWYILLFSVIIVLVIRFLTLTQKCPKYEKKKFDNFENSRPLFINGDLEVYEISKKCNACGHTETWYLKRTFDSRNKTIDRYMTDRPDF